MTRAISAALKTHLAQQYQTMATCWRVQLVNGTVLQFTDHDQDIVIAGYANPDLNGTYAAVTGYAASNIDTTNALDIDTLEVDGVLVSPSITEADLHAGIWDFAGIIIFQVNWADTTMGPLYERVGTLGQVTIERGRFKAELRGLTQAYSRTLGQLVSPSCRYDLGDSNCTVALGGFTVTGTLTGVNVDQLTLYDTGRAEPGPGGGVNIVGVSNANPGVVTMANASLQLTQGQIVVLSGIVGPARLNTVTIARNPSGATFQLTVDTTDTAAYPPYSSGGVVTPFGSNSGYFDHGLLTFTSGPNIGLGREVKSYVPGQFVLTLPFPYTISVGDAYSVYAGCDKSFATCKAKFNNVVNFGGEPYLAGIDKLVQVGRHS